MSRFFAAAHHVHSRNRAVANASCGCIRMLCRVDQQFPEAVRVKGRRRDALEIYPLRWSLPDIVLMNRQGGLSVELLIGKLGIKDDCNFVSRLPLIGKQVLENANLDRIHDLGMKLFVDFAAKCIHGTLSELDSATKRTVKGFIFDCIESPRDKNSRCAAKYADRDNSNLGHGSLLPTILPHNAYAQWRPQGGVVSRTRHLMPL